jgi:hypothetical protein
MRLRRGGCARVVGRQNGVSCGMEFERSFKTLCNILTRTIIHILAFFQALALLWEFSCEV